MSRKEAEDRLPAETISKVAIAWATVVAAVLAWQAYRYEGLFALLAEWQFRHWDRMFPVASIATVTLLLSLPFIIIIGAKMRRRRRLYGRLDSRSVVSRDGRIAKWLAAIAGALALAAFVLTIIGLSIGGVAEKSAYSFSLSDPPPEGSARVRASGWLQTGLTGYYRESLVLAKRDLYVAPLVGDEASKKLKFFVQVPPSRERTSFSDKARVEGVMRKASLPGGLEELYENEGYVVDHPTYVIFKNAASARWPFLSAAADLAILALLAALCWALFRLHLRRIAPSEPKTGD